MCSLNLPDGVEVDMFLMLAGDQVHDGQRVGRRHVPHPVCHARVRTVQVIIVTVLKYLQIYTQLNNCQSHLKLT